MDIKLRTLPTDLTAKKTISVVKASLIQGDIDSAIKEIDQIPLWIKEGDEMEIGWNAGEYSWIPVELGAEGDRNFIRSDAKKLHIYERDQGTYFQWPIQSKTNTINIF